MSVTAAGGFVAAGVHAGLRKSERRDLALVRSLAPAVGAGMFTANRVQAAPVTLCREHLELADPQAVVVNSAVANAATGQQGVIAARATAAEAAWLLGLRPEQVLVLSTGVIGKPLPVDKVLGGVRCAALQLSRMGGAAAAEAIMTTDTQPKESLARGEGFVVGGMAKGSGMIHPDLATMLAVVTTDYPLEQGESAEFLKPAVDASFNAISVDGECSTNDSVILLANGVWLVDDTGRRYLDFAAGIAVVALGHRHPAPLAAAHAQLDRLWHASNLFATEPAAELAARLAARFDSSQAFFCNSGAEANEAALKYARKATGKAGVIALEGGFHGRTTGALALTGQRPKREAFEPLLGGIRFAIPNDIGSLAAVAGADVGLILPEPVLGEGGVIPLTAEFAASAAALARDLGALLCFDEAQTGVGRTGAFFAWEQLGVEPQLVTLAKGLANGLPIGCLLVAEDAAGAFEPGDHGSTFGGNPVTCAAACAVLDAIDEPLLESVRENGARLLAGLATLPGVVEARGAGLLVGAELEGPSQPVVDAALDAGLVCLTSGPNVLRLAPPLVIAPEHVDRALAILAEVLA